MNFFATHPGFDFAAWAIFAAVVDSMPPLPASASYWLTWMHNALQAMSLNFSRIQRPSLPAGPAKQ